MKGHLFCVLVLEGLVDLHRTIQLQLLQHYWLGHRLGLLWYWKVCLGNEQRSFCCFWDCIQVLHFGLFCWLWWLLSFFKGFLPTVVDIMIIKLNSTIPVHCSSLIAEMSMFTLAISCLTISNLPWFMDLIFQVPMWYYSLQHQTLFLSPVTSTTGYCFCFGSVSSFFLELFLHWSPVAYWAPTNLGSSSFNVLSFCLFILFMGFSRQYWSGLPFSFPVDHILSELSTMIHSSWVILQGMAHSFTELDKTVVHVIRLVSFLWLWFSVSLPSDWEG